MGADMNAVHDIFARVQPRAIKCRPNQRRICVEIVRKLLRTRLPWHWRMTAQTVRGIDDTGRCQPACARTRRRLMMILNWSICAGIAVVRLELAALLPVCADLITNRWYNGWPEKPLISGSIAPMVAVGADRIDPPAPAGSWGNRHSRTHHQMRQQNAAAERARATD